MEQLNRIELRGMVGSTRLNTVGERKVMHFTLATSRAYRDKEGQAVIDTTWHNVTAWENKEMDYVDQIKRGAKLYVVGRLKNSKFLGSDGIERNATEIIASRVEFVNDELSYEM